MSHRLLRLTAALLVLTALLVGLVPPHSSGLTADAAASGLSGATSRTFLPLVVGGAGTDTTPPAPVPPGFTEVGRTATTRTFIGQRDGRTVALVQSYFEPTAYYDEATASWQAIDPQIVADGVGYRNAAADFTATFSRGNATGQLVTLGRPGQPHLAVALPTGTNTPSPVIAADTITYPVALPAADLVYTVRPWGLKEEVVLAGPGAPASYDLRLQAPGVTVEALQDGGYLLRDAAGVALWRVPAPVGADAAGASAPLSLSLTRTGDTLLAHLSVEEAWLRDAARVYPIRLDPSFANPSFFSGESDVQQIGGGGMYNHQNRFLGYINQPNADPTLHVVKGITRIFTPVDLSVLPAGMQSSGLLAARIVFTQYVRYSTAPLGTTVKPVLVPWDQQSINWDNQPTGTSLGDAVATATLSGDNGAKAWDITAWTRDVLNASRPNYGLTIRAADESQPGRVFRSSNCGSYCTTPAEQPYLEFEIVLDSGLNPNLDTWAWANREGLPSFDQFANDYGVPATTHLITETHVLQVISATDSLSLPIGLASLGMTSTIPLSVTAGLTTTGNYYLPRPISYLYEETVVKAIYDDQFSAAYSAAMKGGLCLGMTATVGDFYDANAGREPTEFGAPTVRTIADAAPAQDYIQTYHGRQVGSQVLNWMAGPGRMDVQTYYNRLAARIGGDAWHNDPEIIGILKGSGCDDVEIGHALLPYKLVMLPNQRARVYVYDPNYPPTSANDGDNRAIELNLATGSWSYELAPGITWVGKDLFSTPLQLIQQQPVQPTASDTDIVALEGGHSHAFGGHSYAFGGHSHAFGGHSHAFGDDTHTGCYVAPGDVPQFVRQITSTMRITPLTGPRDVQTFPDALFFPAGQAWTFTGVGARNGGVADTMLFGPHALAGYLSTASATTRDSLEMDAAFRRATFWSDETKLASLYQIRESDAWTRVYALNNTTVTPAPLSAEVSADLGSLTVINLGAARQYDLGLGHYGSDGIGQMTFPAQPIGANERRIYTPLLWNDLAHSPVLVQIDLGNDGSIDRVELLGGTVFPAAVSLAAAPTTIGALMTVIADDKIIEHNGGHRGWLNLSQIITPTLLPPTGEAPSSDGLPDGDTALRFWLSHEGNPGLQLGSGIGGVAGTHGGVMEDVGNLYPGKAELYKVGKVVIVPLYDTVYTTADWPLVYRVGGFALVRIVYGDDDDKRVVGELLARFVP